MRNLDGAKISLKVLMKGITSVNRAVTSQGEKKNLLYNSQPHLHVEIIIF